MTKEIMEEGWVLVPKVPDNNMRDAARFHVNFARGASIKVWDDMLAAAPSLSRPAADRGQIVEECARVAEQYNDGTGFATARGIASAIRALSPAEE